MADDKAQISDSCDTFWQGKPGIIDNRREQKLDYYR